MTAVPGPITATIPPLTLSPVTNPTDTANAKPVYFSFTGPIATAVITALALYLVPKILDGVFSGGSYGED